MIVITRTEVLGELDAYIARYERLVTDLKELRDGVMPESAVIGAAPVLDFYQLSTRPCVCLIGTVLGHPTVKSGPCTTSELCVMAPELGWARTWSRYYALGRPAITRGHDG